jgi:hypothetical protein
MADLDIAGIQDLIHFSEYRVDSLRRDSVLSSLLLSLETQPGT